MIHSLDNKSGGRQSIASNLMKNEDEVDDGDSMSAFVEGDAGMHHNQFTFRQGVLNVKKNDKKIPYHNH